MVVFYLEVLKIVEMDIVVNQLLNLLTGDDFLTVVRPDLFFLSYGLDSI